MGGIAAIIHFPIPFLKSFLKHTRIGLKELLNTISNFNLTYGLTLRDRGENVPIDTFQFILIWNSYTQIALVIIYGSTAKQAPDLYGSNIAYDCADVC